MDTGNLFTVLVVVVVVYGTSCWNSEDSFQLHFPSRQNSIGKRKSYLYIEKHFQHYYTEKHFQHDKPRLVPILELDLGQQEFAGLTLLVLNW